MFGSFSRTYGRRTTTGSTRVKEPTWLWNQVESRPKPVVRLRDSLGCAREADEVIRSDYADFPITLEISFRDY
jgi:hypothetical protein